jgi:hypothetical protein
MNIKRVERTEEKYFVEFDKVERKKINYVRSVYTDSKRVSRTLKHVSEGTTYVRRQERREVSERVAKKLVAFLKKQDMIAFTVFTKFIDVDETIPDKRFWKMDTKREK